MYENKGNYYYDEIFEKSTNEEYPVKITTFTDIKKHSIPVLNIDLA